MHVDQAIYGIVRNGHGLRSASGDQRLAADLALRLDLPDTAPPNVTWSPFTSGFVVSDRYVLARTFSDPAAGRAGMVLTHALVCPLAKIVELNDLRPILGHLIATPGDAPAEAKPLEIEAGSAPPSATPELAAVARALVTPGAGPVVRLGTEGFEELMVALWAKLWPSLRRNLYFRLSFGPNDIAETPPPTIVCTPASLVGRWQVHRVSGQAGSAAHGAARLIDGSSYGEAMRRFADGIEAKLDDFASLRVLEQAQLLATSEPDTVSSLASAVRLIERLSPSASSGVAAKRALIDRLVAALPTAVPADILKLRNLGLPGFASGSSIWQAVETWMSVSGYPASDDGETLEIVRDALVTGDAHANWRDAAKRGMASSSTTRVGAFQCGFWRWADADPGITRELVGLIADDDAAVASAVATAPPKMAANTAKSVIEASARFRLFQLHAVAAGLSMGTVEAARAQSHLEPGDDPAAMRIALRNAKPTEILDAVTDVEDARLLAIAAETVARTPTLLGKRDMSNDANRRIWSSALAISPEAWRGPADPRAAMDALLAEQIEGRRPPAKLLEQLSSTPLSDVTSFPRRAELWRHLADPVSDRLLTATTDAWFARVDGKGGDPAAEPELAERILQDPRLDQLLAKQTTGGIADALRIVDALGGLGATKFRAWASAAVRSNRPLVSSDADLLGRAVATRSAHDVVGDLLLSYRGGRSDLNPALRHCLSLMGFWDKLFLDISPTSNTEKWDSLAMLAAELYPTGPDQDALWGRAGGRDHDLRHNGTGHERWRAAIRNVQNGRTPRAPALIAAMRADFPENPNLRMLTHDELFRH